MTAVQTELETAGQQLSQPDSEETEAKNGNKRARLLGPWLVLIVVLALAMTGFSRLGPYHSQWMWLVRAAIAAAAVAVAIVFFYRRSNSELTDSVTHRKLGDETAPLLDERLAVTLARRVGRSRTLTPLEAQVFALAITNPANMRPRLVESYEAARRTLRQQVTMELQLPTDFLAGLAPTDREPPPATAQPETGLRAFAVPKEDRAGDPAHELLLPVPIVINYKGELNDDFWITDQAGALLHKLAYSEYLELASGVLHLLLFKAASEGGIVRGQPEKPALPHTWIAAELAALRCIMQRGEREQGEIDQAVRGIKSLGLELRDNNEVPPELRLAAELVRKLGNRYAIVAPVLFDTRGRATVRYERTVIPGLRIHDEHRNPKVDWLKGWLTLLFGARPVRLSVRLDAAATCQSYHMLIKCPEGLYLRNQNFDQVVQYLEVVSCLEHSAAVAADAAAERDRRPVIHPVTVAPYYRPRQRLGQPYAHFYTRFFPVPREPEISQELNAAAVAEEEQSGAAVGEEEQSGAAVAVSQSVAAPSVPWAGVTFVEVPPGSLFRGTIASVASFVLIWLVGFVVSHGGNPGTDAPAILLAFPAVLAGWLGIEAPSRRLLEGTLIARMSLLLSAVFAIAASGLFMAYQAKIGVLRGSIPFPFSVSFLGIGQTSWALLCAAALANAMHVTYRWLRSTWEYRYLCARPSTMGTVVEQG